MTPDAPSLAQQAMNRYDEAGEQAMLDFVQQHADSAPQPFHRDPRAISVLSDHTAVMANSYRYFFLWTPQGDDPPHPLTVTRARSLTATPLQAPAAQRPLPISGAATPARVLHEVLKHLETDVALGLGYSETGSWLADDPPIGPAEVSAAAPALLDIVEATAAAGHESDEAYQLMDAAARDMSQQVLSILPMDDRNALSAAIRTALLASPRKRR